MIKLGNNNIDKVALGVDEIDRGYLGVDLLWVNNLVVPTDVYISAAGNDITGDGSVSNPWKTIAMANFVAASGKRIWFRGGDIFMGRIIAKAGCKYNSYGVGKATINSGDDHGFHALNAGGVECRNLIFIGTGTQDNFGIYYQNTLWTNTFLTGCIVDGCVVSGYGADGIRFEIMNYPSGYQSPLIQNNEVFDTANHILTGHTGGIIFTGFDQWGLARYQASFRDVNIFNNYVHDVKGALNARSHTGNGILIAQTDTALIQGNVVTDCGENSTAHSGPVGIWCWDSIGVVIRKNTVLRQKTFGPDGSGFDLDGGCVDCVLEYNYSRECKGPGLLIFAFDDLKDGEVGPIMRLNENNVARYNFSLNDGNNNEYSRYSFFIGTVKPVSADFKNIKAYHNTVVSNTIGENAPDCCNINTFGGVDMDHCQGIVTNNLFIQRSEGLLIDIRRNQIDMEGNVYFSLHGTPRRYYGFDWNTMEEWVDSTGDNGPPYGPKEFRYNSFQFYDGDPRVVDQAGDDPSDFMPVPGSPIIGIGHNLLVEYGIAIETEDYLGNPVDTTQLLWTPGCLQPPAPVNQLASPSDISVAPWAMRGDAATIVSGLTGRLGGATAQKVTPNTGSFFTEIYQPRTYPVGTRTVRRGVVIKGDDIDCGMMISQVGYIVDWMNSYFNMRTPQYEKSEPTGTQYIMDNVRMQKRENGFYLVFYDLTFSADDTIGFVPTNLTGSWGVTGNGSRGLIIDEVFEHLITP